LGGSELKVPQFGGLGVAVSVAERGRVQGLCFLSKQYWERHDRLMWALVSINPS
jgi:hypothetical protein